MLGAAQEFHKFVFRLCNQMRGDVAGAGALSFAREFFGAFIEVTAVVSGIVHTVEGNGC